MRKLKFENGNFYHIFNRGVDKREIFSNKADYFKFFSSMNDFNNKLLKDERDLIKRRESEGGKDLPELSSGNSSGKIEKLVDVICYNLLPNHFHFLLKQLVDDGIRIFMHKIGTGYTNYFNLKNERSGSLFQGPFKSVSVESDEQLLYLSAYVNGNAEIHKIAPTTEWPWSSCMIFYGDKSGGSICNTKTVLDEFRSIDEYKKFMNDIIKDSAKRKEEIRSLSLE